MSGAAENQRTRSRVHSDGLQTSAKSTQNTSSADNGSADANPSDDGGAGDQEQGAGGSERTGSPEPNCAICLGALENKSFTDSCFHMFCFVCLQEWSKVKAECPLCKQPFKSIIHNVKSYNSYEQFYLDHHAAEPEPMRLGSWHFDRSFRYRTTLTMDHRYITNYRMFGNGSMPVDVSLQRPSRYPLPSASHYHLRSRGSGGQWGGAEPATTTGTTSFRRRVYESGLRVTGVRTSQRRRTASPEFFRANPAQTHRLVPWLNRELNALLHGMDQQVTFVLELIMDLIMRFFIDSEEFYEHIHPYFRHHTRHFMHEFLFFARSPYTMQTYDTRAVYEPSTHTVSDSESSNDSDVVVVDDDDAEEVGRPGGSGPTLRAAAVGGAAVSRNPGHSDEMHSPSVMLGQATWDSPTPGPSWDLERSSLQSPVNVDISSDSDASTIIDPSYVSPTAPQNPPPSAETMAWSHDSSEGDDVIFVSYDKPWEERSPIKLSSGSDDERYSKYSKRLKREQRKRKRRDSSGNVPENFLQSSSGSRRRDCLHSSAPPLGHHCRSRSTQNRSSSHLEHPSSHRKNKQDRHHRRKRRSDILKYLLETDSSEKRGHSRSSSRSKSSQKKKDHADVDQEGPHAGEKKQKKHKHKKKHKKSKDRTERHSRRGDRSHHHRRSSQVATETATSARDESDRCKKHPSGHKKSRLTMLMERIEGRESGREAKAGSSSGHQSDGLTSDASSSSTSSMTSVTSSAVSCEPSSSSHFSRQQRVQQVLQERCQTNAFPMLSGMDLAPSWENISRLATMLASHTNSHFSGRPQLHSSNPVIIPNSSDESDVDDGRKRLGNDHVRGDSMNVAKTVVVPCSSNLGVPTAAIEVPSTAVSTSTQWPAVEEYINVDSLSSESEGNTSEVEIVDVESLDDTEDGSCTAPSVGCTDFPETDSKLADVTEVSGSPGPSTSASVHPFSIASILNRDVFLGGDTLPQSQPGPSAPSVDLLDAPQEFSFTHSLPQCFESLSEASCDTDQQRSQNGSDGDAGDSLAACPQSFSKMTDDVDHLERREQNLLDFSSSDSSASSTMDCDGFADLRKESRKTDQSDEETRNEDKEQEVFETVAGNEASPDEGGDKEKAIETDFVNTATSENKDNLQKSEETFIVDKSATSDVVGGNNQSASLMTDEVEDQGTEGADSQRTPLAHHDFDTSASSVSPNNPDTFGTTSLSVEEQMLTGAFSSHAKADSSPVNPFSQLNLPSEEAEDLGEKNSSETGIMNSSDHSNMCLSDVDVRTGASAVSPVGSSQAATVFLQSPESSDEEGAGCSEEEEDLGPDNSLLSSNHAEAASCEDSDSSMSDTLEQDLD